MTARLVVCVFACWLAGATAAVAQTSHLLVVVGLSGDHENAERFHAWASALVDAALSRFGLVREHVTYLAEDPARDAARISGRSTREGVVAAVTQMAGRVRPGDRVFIVLIGHGASATPGAPRLNLPGADLTAADFARLLDRFAAQHVTFVNTASASGGFVAALAGRDRVIVAATRSDGERNQTRFGEFFADAFTSGEADQDKDGRISVLEAFAYTRARVEDSYKRDGQLLTEHAMLDDDGDGQGTDSPGAPGGDGALARTLFLSAGPSGAAGPGAAADPVLRALVERRQALEEQIAALKAAREGLDAARYQRDLEALLIELARVSRAIREKQKS